MSLKKIHLRKLLHALGASEPELIKLLRTDIRQELAKENGKTNGGGDFHVPFWSDAKDFVLTGADFEELTNDRVKASSQRKRLYPELHNGFMYWWQNKRRFSNEEIKPFPTSIKARVSIDEISSDVKVENFLGLSIGDNDKRFIYPYFSESPTLVKEDAGIGLFLISEAFPKYNINDFRILDVLRGQTFSTEDIPLNGQEREALVYRFGIILKKWDELKKEYE